MNFFRNFLHNTKTTIFLTTFFIAAFFIFAIYIALFFITNSILADYKEQYFTEKAYQMGFIFRTGYESSDDKLMENRELFNKMAKEFSIPVEFISGNKRDVIYSNEIILIDFEDSHTIELPIVKDGETVGFLRTYFDLDEDLSSPSIVALEKNLKGWLSYIVVSAILLAIGICLMIAKKYGNRIDDSALYAVKIMKGNREEFVPQSVTNEINLLIDSINYLLVEFNHMEVWRKRMMEDVTHELRTPLTSVLARLEAIIDGVYPNSEKNLQDIYEELERFTRLVNSVQQLSEAEGAKFKLNIKKVSIIPLVKGVFDGFMFVAKQKNIDMHFINPNIPCNVYIDPDKMIQVVTNIISNALKYTPTGGNIWIRFEIGEDDFTFYCQDTGMGIPEEDLDLIFNRFYRIDPSRSRENGGSGIGLSISKALVHAHGGEIGVKSEVGIGSEFWVKVPLDNQLVSKVD